MQYIKVVGFIISVVCLELVVFSESKPYKFLDREKRVSDQRLAELETLIALTKMKGKLVTVPVGYGRVDPYKLGRKRRSIKLLVRDLLDSAEEPQEYDYASNSIEYMPEEVYRHFPVRLPE